MAYKVVVPRPVQKQLDDLPENVRRQAISRILTLKDNPRPPGCVKLKGLENEFRIRIGDYRLRYEIHDTESVVLLLHCKHRRDIYKDKQYLFPKSYTMVTPSVTPLQSPGRH